MRKAGGLLALVIECQVMSEGSGMAERHHLSHAPHLLRLVRFRVFQVGKMLCFVCTG